jgi:hypothetical protein
MDPICFSYNVVEWTQPSNYVGERERRRNEILVEDGVSFNRCAMLCGIRIAHSAMK